MDIERNPALQALRFDNAFTAELPADPVSDREPRQVEGALYSRVSPEPVAAPVLVHHSREVADWFGLSEADVRAPAFAAVFAGNQMLEGMDPHAQCYGGHQFGHWAGQLGDGRAIVLGEALDREGRRWALQLKGAGRTPYSRGADGRAVLRSSLREFVCSEAMHHLGVPTTRALSLVATGDGVVRDMFYDGRPETEPGAICCRVSQSFLRLGSFQLPAARGDLATLRTLLDYTLRHFYPDCRREREADSAAALLHAVAERTATLMVHWQRVGFVHGVMNTDNLSILGETIDYGPYGWLEDYDPNWTPNTTDAQGRRYRYGAQPQVALWNLAQFARALYPLVEDEPALNAGLEHYRDTFEAGWRTMMAAKLGLSAEGDHAGLIEPLLAQMQRDAADMTLFYRALMAEAAVDDTPAETVLQGVMYSDTPDWAAWTRWLADYRGRLDQDPLGPEQRHRAMAQSNPLYVPRNYLAQLAIDDASAGDTARLEHWLEVLRRPYEPQAGAEAFAAPRPEWARDRAGCSMLSCSS